MAGAKAVAFQEGQDFLEALFGKHRGPLWVLKLEFWDCSGLFVSTRGYTESNAAGKCGHGGLENRDFSGEIRFGAGGDSTSLTMFRSGEAGLVPTLASGSIRPPEHSFRGRSAEDRSISGLDKLFVHVYILFKTTKFKRKQTRPVGSTAMVLNLDPA